MATSTVSGGPVNPGTTRFMFQGATRVTIGRTIADLQRLLDFQQANPLMGLLSLADAAAIGTLQMDLQLALQRRKT
jgi:hypothetical protein